MNTQFFTLFAAILITLVPVYQSTDSAFDFLAKLLSELPVTILVIWLIIKLDDRRTKSIEFMGNVFRGLMQEQQEIHQAECQKLLDMLSKSLDK